MTDLAQAVLQGRAVSVREFLQDCEAEYVAVMLIKHNYDLDAVIEESGRCRTWLYSVMNRSGIPLPRFRKRHARPERLVRDQQAAARFAPVLKRMVAQQ